MSEILKIDVTDKSLAVYANAKTGEVLINGSLYFEKSLDIFKPLWEWLQQYFKEPAEKSRFRFRIDAMCPPSYNWILQILKLIEKRSKEKNCHSEIYWYYQIDDEDMYEEGDYFKEIVDVPFFMMEEE